MSSDQRFSIRIGILSGIPWPPDELLDYARRVEVAGFDELWLAEDCFFNGGISAAASALAVTQKLSVGVGILPAVVRNPVFAAMEIATLARLYPNRFLPGFGHGIAGWMRQIGAFPKSQLGALEEVTVTVRRLLRGETVTYDGTQVHLTDAKLVFPPDRVPPVSLGVVGPKSLALSGRTADGTILPEFSPPAFIRWARQQIEAGREAAGRSDNHRLTVYAWCAVDPEAATARDLARQALAPMLAQARIQSQLAPLGIVPDIQRLLATTDPDDLAGHIPDEWLKEMGLIGNPQDCLDAVIRYVQAGADSLILFPLPGQDRRFLEQVTRDLLPYLSAIRS